MKIKRGRLFESFRYICLIPLIALGLITIVGTGGGGGGGAPTPSISYTGVTTQATIDEDNAEDMIIGAYLSGNTGFSTGGIGAVQVGEDGSIGGPQTVKISQALKDSLYRVDVMSRSGGGFVGAIYTDSGTVYGDCGGNASYAISVDDQTGQFSGSMSYSSYCALGVVISGSANFSGQVNVNTGDLLRFSFSFSNLTAISVGDSLTLNGNISFDVSSSPAILTISMLIGDDSTGKVFWVKDYTITLTEEIYYVQFTISGTYYDPDYGFGTLTTPNPFVIYSNDFWPSQGVLDLTGNTGIGGGSTKARLIALSTTTYGVQADTTGDGIYDWDSGVLLWSDL